MEGETPPTQPRTTTAPMKNGYAGEGLDTGVPQQLIGGTTGFESIPSPIPCICTALGTNESFLSLTFLSPAEGWSIA